MAVNIADPALSQAWNNLTTKDGDKTWILFGFSDEKSNVLVPIGSGSGGIDELKTQLDENAIQYGAFRVVGVDDRETTVSRRAKYVWFSYIGKNVSVLRKARVSVQKPEVAKLFPGAGLTLELTSADDLTKIDVSKKLLASGGAHMPTAYEFANGDQITVASLL